MSGDLLKGWGVTGGAAERLREEELAREVAAEKEAARLARVQRAREDPQFFCQYYLPHYFRHPVTGVPTDLCDFQLEVLDEAERQELLAVAAPRGHGKTTLISFALTLRDVVLKRSEFVIYIGPTWSDAIDRITEIRTELEENDRIIEDFGDLVRGEDKVVRGQRQDDLNLSNGARIMARGSGQSLRGKKKKERRPDRVVLDDVDKDGETANPKRVDQRVRWFKRVVLGLGGAGKMRVLVVGNIIARRTLLTDCLTSKRFKALVYRAIQDDGSLLMPSLWTREKLEEYRESIGTDAFETEFQNNPPTETARLFQPQWLQRRWTHELLAAVDPGIVTFIDLSKGKTERSDFQAIVSIRMDRAGHVYVMKADIGRRTKNELARRIFTYHEALGLSRIVGVAVEANGFQEWFAEGLDAQAAAEGVHLPITQVINVLNKYDRISRISPIAEGGRLWFPPEAEEDEGIRLLRSQLEMFPDDRHDDGPDALTGAIEEAQRRRRGSSSRALDVGVHDREYVAP